MKKIKFSIVTPTYNRAQSGFLDKCIKSLQNQDVGNFNYEHIIVNDGSTDNTEELLGQYMVQDKRIRLVTQKNLGVAKAVKNGIGEASGDYIIIMDDDDFLTKDSLKKRAEYIFLNPSIDWFYGLAIWVDENGKELSIGHQSVYFKDFLYEDSIVFNKIHGGTPTIKKTALKEIHWPDWLNRSQDYFLWLELLRPKRKLKVGFINDFLLYYTRHKEMYTLGYQTKKGLLVKEKINNKIKELHINNIESFCKTLGSVLSKYRRKVLLEEENQAKDKEIEILRAELFRKEKLIDEILNSKRWKFFEKLSKIRKFF